MLLPTLADAQYAHEVRRDKHLTPEPDLRVTWLPSSRRSEPGIAHTVKT